MLTLVILLVDLAIPLGVAVRVMYAAAILISFWSPKKISSYFWPLTCLPLQLESSFSHALPFSTDFRWVESGSKHTSVEAF
jgi:hypothetical protein